MTNYITYEDVLSSLENQHKNTTFQDENILNWCMDVETIFIADPDSMWKYLEIPLSVVSQKVALPSNLYKLIDVYDPEDPNIRIPYHRRGSVLLVNENYNKDTVSINYAGTPLDRDTCMPLIYVSHKPACEVYCKIQHYEEDVLLAKVNQNIYFDWKQRFDNMIQSAKVNFENWGAQEFNHMTIIHGNELPRIGFTPLAHNAFGEKQFQT